MTDVIARSLALRASAEAAARSAGAYLRSQFGGQLAADPKLGHFDIVTVHDRHAEGLITASLLAAHPDSVVIGEEGGGSATGDTVWYVDPIDGTSNFASGLPFYCVSIGVAVDGALVAGVVYDPERDEMFSASLAGAALDGIRLQTPPCPALSDALVAVGWPYSGVDAGYDEHTVAATLRHEARAVRNLGSCALQLAYVAAGRITATSELIAKPWDVAAGFLLVTQAGGAVAADRRRPSEDDAPRWYAPAFVAHAPAFPLDASALAVIRG